MIAAPKITEDQQKQFRYDFTRMIEEFVDQNQLVAFRKEWDGAVHFQILDDHTVRINISGEEKLPPPLKEKVREMRNRFEQMLHS
jgi:hypothetical protein